MPKFATVPVKLPVIILAAGHSERMMQPKPFLQWDKTTTFLEKIVTEYYTANAGQITIILNKEGYEKVKIEIPQIIEYAEILINEQPEKGRLSSMKLGLQYLPENSSCYIQNIDNPFVNAKLLDAMDHLAEPDAYVVPVYDKKGGHPVLIGTKVVDYILSYEKDDDDLRQMLNNFRRIEVQTDDKHVLVNINSIDDYHTYFSHLK
jgi:molybdenum cofactor cytidylyltransferase